MTIGLRTSWLAVIPLALIVHPAQGQTAADTTAVGDQPQSTLQEVLVTAQKREQPLLDVPVPVTAISADTLLEKNQTQLVDYYLEVPGLSINSTGNGQNTIAIRGITTGQGANPAVGVTIDDIPYGSSTVYGFGSVLMPDLDPADLSQVEVLRGPQGTLYGASSLGGLIKFLTTDPSLTGLTGRAQVDLNSIDHGGQGYGASAYVSLPLIADKLAISASGFKREDAGFINDPTQGRKDVNQVDVSGGRLAALFKPSEDFSVKIQALSQDIRGNGADSVAGNARFQPTLGDLTQSQAPGTGIYDLKVRFYSAVLMANLGRYQLTSLTGYGVNDYQELGQFGSTYFGGLAKNYFGVSGTTLLNLFQTKKLSQEVRLSSPSGETLEWMLGVFYTRENTPVSQLINAANPATGATAGVLVDFDFPTTYQEYAGFGDLTVHFTDRFDTQFGLRESENRQTYNESDFGVAGTVLFGSNPYVFLPQSTKANALTYLVTPRFKVSPDLMLYARVASGYRPGGNNGEATAFNLPLTYKPDTTVNYELGAKGKLPDNAISFDASIYYIDWKNIQLEQTDPVSGLQFFSNGGTARSEGVELSVEARPAAGLTVEVTGSYDSAELTEELPLSTGVGFAGDRLPFSPRFAGSLSAEQDIPVTDRVNGFLGTTVEYTGNRLSNFAPWISVNPLTPGYRVEFPAYATADLRGGVQYDAWRVTLYIDNVADERGILSASDSTSRALYTDPYDFTVIQPRTYGLSVSATFR